MVNLPWKVDGSLKIGDVEVHGIKGADGSRVGIVGNRKEIEDIVKLVNKQTFATDRASWQEHGHSNTPVTVGYRDKHNYCALCNEWFV